jgi:hypothetical protein
MFVLTGLGDRQVRAACIAPVVLQLFCGAAICQEVVTNEPLTKSEVIATLPLFALRKLPVDQVIVPAADLKNQWAMSASAAVGSALSSKPSSKAEWEGAKNPYGDSNPSRDEWLSPKYSALVKEVDLWQQEYTKKSIAFVNNQQVLDTQNDIGRKSLLSVFVPKAENVAVDNHLTAVIKKRGPIGITYADPDAIGYIFALNRVIKESKNGHTAVASAAINTSSEDFFMDNEFAHNIQEAYSPIKTIYTLKSDSDRLPAVSNAIQQATLNLPVAVATLITEGDAGFGKPLVFTAAEKSLKVEPSLLRTYDIYWIQLAISPTEELIQNINELRYDITIDNPNVLAMTIVPERVETEIKTTDKAAAPTVKVGDVELGEMFSRTVEYQYIRPTILGYGLQTSSFGWIFTGESLDASAKRMFAVIGVPKGTKEITATFQLAAKVVKFMRLASDWASTGPTQYKISLPR